MGIVPPQTLASLLAPMSSTAVCQGTAWRGRLYSPATAGIQARPSGVTGSPSAPVSLGTPGKGSWVACSAVQLAHD